MTRKACVAWVAAVAAWMAAGPAQAADTVTMKLAYATSPSFFHHSAAEVFKKAAEEAAGGALTVMLHPSGQLGGEVQILEGLRSGTIEGYIGTTGAMSGFASALGIVDLPYLWRDYGHAFAVLDGELGDSLRAAAREKGFEILDFWPAGRRDVYGNVRIEKPSDMDGVKIRTLQSDVYLAAFKAFGALPTPLAWPETYGALQQHVIDAAETALSAMIGASQYEVVDYVVLTGHGLTIANFSVAARWFDGLPPAVQDAIRTAEKKARAEAIRLEAASFDDAIEFLEKAGKTIVTPDRAAFQAIVADKVYPQFAERFDPATVKAIVSHP